VYAPEVVAETILHCAEHPVRDVFAGGGGKLVSVLANLAPRLTDKLMEKTDNNLYGPTSALQERSGQASPVHESSLYTQASLHPFLTGAALAATGLTMASYVRRGRSGLATRLPKGQKGREYLAYPW
jgi:hypothetical protein